MITDKVKSAIREITVCYDIISQQQEQIKAICEENKDVIKPTVLKKISSLISKGKAGEEAVKLNEILEYLEGL